MNRSRGDPSPSPAIFSGGHDMILLHSPSRFLLHLLHSRLLLADKGPDLDCHSIEFDDVRYHIQFSAKTPLMMVLSVALPPPPPETVFVNGLPFGAVEAIKAAYGGIVQILDPPKDGYNLTMKMNLGKVPSDEGSTSFFLKQEKVTIVYPMRFQDSVDTVLATSFLQEFVEARRATALNNAPLCMWSPTPPAELKGAPAEAQSANAGFVTFVIFPRHVEGPKLDKTVWSLSTFHAYVRYHVKCSEGFMHTRMRRRVESMIQALDRAKPSMEKLRKVVHGKSFKRLSLETRNNSAS